MADDEAMGPQLLSCSGTSVCDILAIPRPSYLDGLGRLAGEEGALVHNSSYCVGTGALPRGSTKPVRTGLREHGVGNGPGPDPALEGSVSAESSYD